MTYKRWLQALETFKTVSAEHTVSLPGLVMKPADGTKQTVEISMKSQNNDKLHIFLNREEAFEVVKYLKNMFEL